MVGLVVQVRELTSTSLPKEYDFKFNIRSKSGGETFPTHRNGDYFKK